MSLSRKLARACALAAVLLCASGYTECYKPVKNSALPTHIRTVAVPAFQNNALRYKVESRFTEAVSNEIIRRARGLRLQSDAADADAVVDGVIKNFYVSGVLLDSRGRSRIFEVTVETAVTVRDQVENKVLYDNQHLVFRGEFEFSSDPRTFFNEEDPAVERLARAFAESLVSTLVAGFGVNQTD